MRREKSLEGLGRLLKTKREIHGLTRRDVVVKIKIPLDQLEAIEEGRLSSLPPVFAKGFLRAYTNELGLDAEAILEDYRQLTGGFKNEPASREPLAPRYVETSVGKVGGGMGALTKMTLICLILICLFGGLAIWLWPGLRGSLGSSLPFADKISGLGETESGRGDSITIPAGTPAVENNQTSDPSASGGSDDNLFVEDPIINQGGVGGAISGRAPAAVPAGGTLVLTSRMDKVWVDALVDGERQFLWMRNGQKMTWHARRSITITSGQPNALSAKWNDQEISPLSPDSVSVIRVTFPEEG